MNEYTTEQTQQESERLGPTSPLIPRKGSRNRILNRIEDEAEQIAENNGISSAAKYYLARLVDREGLPEVAGEPQRNRIGIPG